MDQGRGFGGRQKEKATSIQMYNASPNAARWNIILPLETISKQRLLAEFRQTRLQQLRSVVTGGIDQTVYGGLLLCLLRYQTFFQFLWRPTRTGIAPMLHLIQGNCDGPSSVNRAQWTMGLRGHQRVPTLIDQGRQQHRLSRSWSKRKRLFLSIRCRRHCGRNATENIRRSGRNAG
jgi:hypothetical protein